jgi:hypothetical protein
MREHDVLARRRRPSNSDWRRPVVPAAGTTSRNAGPSTSGGVGDAGPARPRRLGLGAGRTTSWGIAAITASAQRSRETADPAWRPLPPALQPRRRADRALDHPAQPLGLLDTPSSATSPPTTSAPSPLGARVAAVDRGETRHVTRHAAPPERRAGGSSATSINGPSPPWPGLVVDQVRDVGDAMVAVSHRGSAVAAARLSSFDEAWTTI